MTHRVSQQRHSGREEGYAYGKGLRNAGCSSNQARHVIPLFYQRKQPGAVAGRGRVSANGSFPRREGVRMRLRRKTNSDLELACFLKVLPLTYNYSKQLEEEEETEQPSSLEEIPPTCGTACSLCRELRVVAFQLSLV